MAENVEVRKIPTKSFIYIAVIMLLGILVMLLVESGKATKATKVLNQLGYTNVKDVKVFKKSTFLKEETNIKGYQYSLKFIDLATNKQCQGFIVRDFKGVVGQDLDCKSIK